MIILMVIALVMALAPLPLIAFTDVPGPWAKALPLFSVAILAIVGHRIAKRLAMVEEAFDATNCPIKVLDAHDRLLICNRAYKTLVGIDPETLVPGTHYREIARAGLDPSLTGEAEAAALQDRLDIEQRADGTPEDRKYRSGQWFRVTKVRTSSGTRVGIGVPVTDYHEIKGKLEAEIARFTTLAANAPVGICQTDPHSGEVTFVNEALLGMMGVGSADELSDAALTFAIEGASLTGFGALIAHLGARHGETEVHCRFEAAERHVLVKKARRLTAMDLFASPDAEETDDIAIFVDITDRVAAEQKIRHLALHDPLTGARNRAAFSQTLRESEGTAEEETPVVLCAIDLDRFKPVNDLFGHAAGDSLLCQIVARLNKLLPDDATLFRMGGDEFAVLYRAAPGENRDVVPRAIIEAIETPFVVEDQFHSISASVGTSRIPQDTDEAATLAHYADLALYKAKRGGGGQVHHFDQKLLETTDARRVMEFELREAVERGAFEVVFQNQYGTDRGAPVGVEAFVRWRRRRSGQLVRPNDFLALAEEQQLIDRIDFLVLDRALEQYAEVASTLPGDPPVLSINISARTLSNRNLADRLRQHILGLNLSPDRIALEVSESFALRSGEPALAALRAMADLGVRLVLDDFGTGFSSVRMIAALPLSAVKIDGSLVRELTGTSAARTEPMMRAMIDTARHLGMDAMASGIEKEDTFTRLKALGCTIFQGHHFDTPKGRITLAPAARNVPQEGLTVPRHAPVSHNAERPSRYVG